MLIPFSELESLRREVGPKTDEGRYQVVRESDEKVREGAGWKKAPDTIIETVAGRVLYVGKLSNAQKERMGVTRQDVDYIVTLDASSQAQAGDIIHEYPMEWQPEKRYYRGQSIQPTVPTGKIYICETGGTSGDGEPVWDETAGEITEDGTARWRCAGDALDFPIMQMMGPGTFGDYITKKALCSLRQL